MAEILCGYTADRDETLTAYLYDDIEPAQRAAFEAHIATCERCRNELADLKRVRARLAEWTAPGIQHPAAPVVPVVTNAMAEAAREPSSSAASRGRAVFSALRDIPAWVQVAAACLFLGVSAGIANLDVRYDANGLSVRTGWSRPLPAMSAPPARIPSGAEVSVAPASAPWQGDLEQLERRLKDEWRASTPQTGPSLDAQLLRQVRALIVESERKQQNDLALKIAEVVRDFDARRGADLASIYGGLGAIQNNTRFEVAKQRQWIADYVTQASIRK
jgi:anti-sigma factor RsiW